MIYGTVYYSYIKEAKLIYLYTILSFLLEFVGKLSWIYTGKPLPNGGIVFTYVEVAILVLFVDKLLDHKYRKVLFSITGILFVSWLVAFLRNPNSFLFLYGSASLFELLLCSMYMLKNMSNIFNNWKFTLLFSFFQYNLLSAGIFAFVDILRYDVKSNLFFLLVHAIANGLLYVFMLIGFIQCKKQSTRV